MPLRVSVYISVYVNVDVDVAVGTFYVIDGEGGDVTQRDATLQQIGKHNSVDSIFNLCRYRADSRVGGWVGR